MKLSTSLVTKTSQNLDKAVTSNKSAVTETSTLVLQWLKDKKIEGVKWKNRRLINVPSVFGYLLKKKVIEVSQIKQQELKRELELKEFQK